MSDDKSGSGPQRGYGKPPVEHRFPKGTSGNPRGPLPKQERALMPSQNRRDIFNAAEAFTRVRTAKGEKMIPVIEAIYLRLVQKALGGHGPSIRRMIDLYERACKEHHRMNPSIFGLLELVEQKNLGIHDEDHRRNTLLQSLRKSTKRY